MKNTIGSSVSVTLFGESHGKSIGVVIDGLAPGIEVDEEFIKSQLTLRRPSGLISTSRKEQDPFKIESGVFEGKTTGTPICIIIPNGDTVSKHYSYGVARPSHADYAAYCKYHGFEDYRGGGHFSGRITAALVAAGAIIISALRKKGIIIGSHIKRLGGVDDAAFCDLEKEIPLLCGKEFAVIDDKKGEEMQKRILSAKSEGDSVGGILETAVINLPAGVGEPWFDTVEGMLSKALFSVPAVKGVEFGDGFALADMKGSKANDLMYAKEGKIYTRTNRNGGINGGITNGMPIIFKTAIKPTPTILKEQDTADFIKTENSVLLAVGRHDPCIVHRARVVVDSVTAIVLADLLSLRYGTDWLAE
ncbi:MAG: chorismate synthase [Clostridia bacterium]|nr:chorismate synthase [Clostridia bacterium]